ncbi:nitroreductase [Planoprotostelium fungivorum]|uniref:Nitroreductase n=1 Tax=Planoprotostelium fungivorum TaxID=1890364 RepID=A0A2P6NI89_9EUKA|nr:nitroreductase [Planoprotostelium fungivorum]
MSTVSNRARVRTFGKYLRQTRREACTIRFGGFLLSNRQTHNNMSQKFLSAVAARRSFYGIGSGSPISKNKITDIVHQAVKHTPSSFNSQSARVVVLFGKQHHRVWDITKEMLKPMTNAEQFPNTVKKLDSFRAGHGTILFFEDMQVVRSFQEKYARFQDPFGQWSQQSNGMLQFVVWTALEAEGLGASLQHYNPIIDNKFKDEFKIPDHWSLLAEMPFGERLSQPGEKQFAPVEDRVKVFDD